MFFYLSNANILPNRQVLHGQAAWQRDIIPHERSALSPERGCPRGPLISGLRAEPPLHLQPLPCDLVPGPVLVPPRSLCYAVDYGPSMLATTYCTTANRSGDRDNFNLLTSGWLDAANEGCFMYLYQLNIVDIIIVITKNFFTYVIL